MDKQELTDWALRNGWQILADHPSLVKPSRPKEAIVRLVFKTGVVHVEAKKPAGSWEKLSGATYAEITYDSESDMPHGLGLEKIPSLSMLMRENKDAQVFGKFGG